MYGKGLLKGLGITIKRFFQKNITEQYPDERPVFPERFRGCLQFEFEKCIMCGMCTKVCANDVLSLDVVKDELTNKRKLVRYTIDLQYCMFCNMCVEVCPKSCLYFSHKFELAELTRDDIRIVYDRPEHLDTPEEKASLLYTLAGFKKPEPEVIEDPAPPAPEVDAQVAQAAAAFETALAEDPDKTLSSFMPDAELRQKTIALIQTDAARVKDLALRLAEMEVAQKGVQTFLEPGEATDKPAAKAAAPDIPAGLDKRTAALMTALLKNPDKALAKVLTDEADRKIMAEVMAEDSSKAEKLAKVMAEDLGKAEKVAQAFVKKALKDREKGDDKL